MVWTPPRLMMICSAVGTVAGGAVLLKDAFSGPKNSLSPDIRADAKVFIVTGANTGIGKETTRDLAKRGATVYMACRNLEKCKKARAEIIKETFNGNIYCRLCDLSDFDSVNRFAETFQKEQKRLDVLINNAGVMRCPKMLTKQGIEMQLGVNHMGHFLLTNLLLNVLKASAPSRIVVVSSIAHASGKIKFDDLNSDNSYDPAEAYRQSKLANNLFTLELSKQLKPSQVTVNAVHPGIVNTEITRHMGFSNSFLASIFLKPIFYLMLKSPKQGSQTVLYAALEPSLQNVSGKYFSDCQEKEVSEAAKDPEAARKLWLTSQKWTRMLPERG